VGNRQKGPRANLQTLRRATSIPKQFIAIKRGLVEGSSSKISFSWQL